MKKVLLGLMTVMSLALTSSAFGQYLNTNQIAYQANQLSSLTGQLQQLTSRSPDFRVRQLGQDAAEARYAASTLWRSALGICGVPSPDYVIVQNFERACDPVQRLLNDFQAVGPNCDFRVSQLVNEVAESLEQLRYLVGDSDGGDNHGGDHHEGPIHR